MSLYPTSHCSHIFSAADIRLASATTSCQYSHTTSKHSLTVNRNSTFSPGSPVTYTDHFNEIGQYNVHLNFLEKAWAAWYAYMQNDTLATGIMSFVLHELVYFGRALPFIIMDRIPYFKQFKIQGVSLLTLHSTALTDRSIKCLPWPNNGNAPNLSSSHISRSNYLKYGSSIHWHTTSERQQAYHFHHGKLWRIKLPFFSFLKMHGIIGFTEHCTPKCYTKRSTSFTINTVHHSVLQLNMLPQLKL